MRHSAKDFWGNSVPLRRTENPKILDSLLISARAARAKRENDNSH
jgi:hypothetical protein